ncbi:protein kinase [Streptomyces sp. NPDC048172]|uniref:protein kinase domain-containing protein n=1 Tax=Streptomyces sp. NPDC048172 TaxID=3365505 RepID=UPI003721CADA
MRGRVLSGRYELVEKLGAGGMGEVWRARDRDLGREVAVKLFSPPSDVQPEERAELLGRFRREARAAAALDSPHIATVHDHGADDGVPYLVMELVEGRSLERVLRDEGRVPVRDALDWSAQICRALATAHTAGVVHRDIKPANVVVRPDGTAVVLDFGIARFQEAVEAETKLTRTGHMPLGSVLYMAPERFRMEPGDGRADLYALGCVLYELLVGRPPFVGPAAGVMFNHLNDVPLRPSRARAELTPDVDRLVLDLMAKDADDRPADAESAGRRLEAVREGAGPAKEPEPEPVREAEPVRESEPEDAPPPQPTRTPAPAPITTVVHPPERRRRPSRRVVLAGAAALLVLGGTGVTLMSAKEEAPDPDWTVVYARPEENKGADDAAVEKAVRKGVRASGLKGTLDVAPVDSTTFELEDEVRKLPHVVAVIGETDLSPGVAGDDVEEYGSGYGVLPVTLNACPDPGADGDTDAEMDNSFALRTSPGATGTQLGDRLRRDPGVRSVLLVTESGSEEEFGERLRKSFSGDGREVAEHRLFQGLTQEGRDDVAEVLKKRKPDTLVLPEDPYEGPFTARELRKAGFRGRVVTPLPSTCRNESPGRAPDAGNAGNAGNAEGVDQYRFRDQATDRKSARRSALDAAHALAATLAKQNGTPDSGALRGLLAEDLVGLRVRGANGTFAFGEDGYLKSRELKIDRLDGKGKRWRER